MHVRIPSAAKWLMTLAAVFIIGMFALTAHAQISAPSVSLGHQCHTLSLDNGVSTANAYTEPSVCIVRDTEGKRFYQFSGVFTFTASQGRDQVASFGVSNQLPLYGSTFVPAVGRLDNGDSVTLTAQIQPGGSVELLGLSPGCDYTLSVSGMIPVGVPSDEQAP